jgi:carbon-monoxide dehydrogenase large subunit
MPDDIRGVGASLLRKEDDRHLHGRGEFVADVKLPGTVEVAFLRSPHAHARIKSISVPPEARGRVFTAADLPRVKPVRVVSHSTGAKSPPWPPLATDKVRYVGDAIAACIAPSRGEAEDLANAVAVDFEILDAVIDAPRDMRGSRHPVHEQWGDNLYIEHTLEGGDIEAAARAADVTLTREFRMQRQSGAPLECRGVLAYRDHRLDEVVLYASTQTPHTVRVALAEILDIEERRIRVVAPDVGGGFGPKARLYPEEIVLAALALQLDHPVRWIEDRSEHLLTAAHTRDHHYKVTAYADRQGRILGVDAEIVVDAGAYGLWPQGPYHEASMVARALPGPYTIPNYRSRHYTVATNKTPLGPYRGVGRPGACFVIERLVDEIARAVGREPNEVRTLNLVRPEQMPFATIGGLSLDNGDYPASVELCAELLDLPAVRARQQHREPDGRKIGVGFATFAEQTAHGAAEFASRGAAIIPGFESCTARVLTDGSVVLMVGIQSHGQGLETVLLAGSSRGAWHRPGEHFGAPRRHREHRLRLRDLRIAQHGDVGRRGGARQPYAARQALPHRRASVAMRCRRRALHRRRRRGAAGLGYDRRDRQGRASAYGRPAAGGGSAARRNRDLRAGDKHRRFLLCDARRRRRGRPRDVLYRAARLRRRRGLRHDGQPAARRGPDQGRRRAGHRHRAVRGNPL